MFDEHSYGDRSRMVHGTFENPNWDFSHSIALPMTTSTAYRLSSANRGARGFQEFGSTEAHDETIFIYQRLDDPCQSLLEERLAFAEHGEMAVCFASGMAAVSAAFGVTLQVGDHLIAHHTIYGCTHSLINRWLIRQGIEHTFVNFNDPVALKASIRPNTKALYFESPCNPNLDLIDIQAICKLAKAKGLKTILDNTFATPFGQRALPTGVDLVVHSLTKGISGFGTEMGGAVIGSKAFETDLRVYRKDFGGSLAPQTAWHILNYGLPTLSMRLERQQRSAQTIAEFLEKHPKVAFVRYPGLESFPQGCLARRQMRGVDGEFAPGTLLCFELKGEESSARRLMDKLADQALCVTLAVSLGQVRTLIEHPASMTHSAMNPEELQAAGISQRCIRLSLGIEDPNDIIADLSKALEAI